MLQYLQDDPELLPALTLAYIGDGYYEMAVRNYLLKQGLRRVDDQIGRASCRERV